MSEGRETRQPLHPTPWLSIPPRVSDCAKPVSPEILDCSHSHPTGAKRKASEEVASPESGQQASKKARTDSPDKEVRSALILHAWALSDSFVGK